MFRKSVVLLFALVVLALVAGCASVAPAPVAPPATKTPKPTFTPTPDWTPTSIAFATVPATTAPVAVAPTAAPTAAPVATEAQAAPTAAATAEPTAPPPAETRLTATQNVNVRSGPGTVYPAIGRLTAGQSFAVTGRNDGGDWVKFDFNGRDGWVTFALVSIEGDLDGVEIAQAPAIPTARPQPTARPRPTNPPAQPTNPPAPPPAAGRPWMLVQGSPKSAPQCGTPYFKGMVQYKNGSPQNGVCVLLDRYGPRQIKYSGSDGQNGAWGFTPCGEENCGQIKIYVVQCPSGVTLDPGGLSITPGMAVPPAVSDVFEINMTDKCAAGQWENIIFRNSNE